MWSTTNSKEESDKTLRSVPLLIISPACVVIEIEGMEDTPDPDDSSQSKRQQSTLNKTKIIVYDRKSGAKLWEGKREASVVLREADDSWYLLRREGLFSLVVGQTRERLLHNMIMGGRNLVFTTFLKCATNTDC